MKQMFKKIFGTSKFILVFLPPYMKQSKTNTIKMVRQEATIVRQIVEENMVVTIQAKDIAIFQMIADGKPTHEIAKVLGISVRTVEGRIGAAMIKTGCKNRTEVAILFLRNKLIK